MLVAIRENEQRARFVGYPTNRYKLVAFVVSAALTGLAGMLLLFNNRMTSADPISVAFSGELLAMVIIGGMRSFLGPALGALFFILFREYLSHLHRELAALVRPAVRRLHRVLADRAGRRRRAADRAVPQDGRRGRGDGGAPRSSDVPLPAFLRPQPHVDGAGAGGAAASPRASAASRPCEGVDISRRATARCTR